MGGAMPYSRWRARNHLAWRPDEPGLPYPHQDVVEEIRGTLSPYLVLGDLNRMEQDYLGLSPQPVPLLDGGGYTFMDYGIIHDVADASGVDAHTCRTVLAAFFGYPHPFPDPEPRRPQ